MYEEEYTKEQMLQIRLGECNNVDVSVYKRPDYNSYRMCLIRIALQNKMDITEYVSDAFECEDAVQFMNCMKALQEKIKNKRDKQCADLIVERAKKKMPRFVKSLLLLNIIEVMLRLAGISEMITFCKIASIAIGIFAAFTILTYYKVQNNY